MAKVSIIVPVYNVERYLDRCVESLVHQTLDDIEIILVDDCSTDSSGAICDKWVGTDNRIRVVHKAQNEGLGMARNTGLSNAIGEYVMFLDSDDTYHQEACQRFYLAASNSDVEIVTGCFNNEINPGEWVEAHELNPDTLLDESGIRQYMLDMIANPVEIDSERSHPVSVCVLCIKRGFLEEQNLRFMSERKIASEDTLFKISLLQRCRRMMILDYPFYNYYINGTSLTHTFKMSAFEGLIGLKKAMLELFDGDAEAAQRINRFIIADARSHIFKLVSSDSHNKYSLLRQMLNNPLWEGIDFPINRLPLFKRIFSILCVKNMPLVLYIFANLIVKLKK